MAEDLHRVLDKGPRRRWWRRQGASKRFYFVDSGGQKIRDSTQVERIRRLVIPPAWQHVRIAPSARAHIQAMGLDGSGRAQYIYNRSYREHQNRKKFERTERFGEFLPELRRATSQHLNQPGLPKERVLAVLVRLINRLYFRLGSVDGTRRYHTYGATTLRNRHVKIIDDGTLLFSFDGKHHVHHRRLLVDKALVEIVARLKELGGREFFQYVDDAGRVHPIRARDVNEYIKSITSSEFTAKDFRTWAGTLIVAKELAAIGPATSERQRKKNIAQAVRAAAEKLGNTPSVCRKSYLHPAVLRAYEKGLTLGQLNPNGMIHAEQEGFTEAELALLELFQLARRGRNAAPAAAPEPQIEAPIATPDAGYA